MGRARIVGVFHLITGCLVTKEGNHRRNDLPDALRLTAPRFSFPMDGAAHGNG